MKRIFISGPYTKGDVAINVKNAMDCAAQLIDLGLAPYCPHLTHFLHLNKPQPYQTWLDLDMSFMVLCDAVIRLKGESAGADAEVAEAKARGIPVFEDIEDLLYHLKSKDH